MTVDEQAQPASKGKAYLLFAYNFLSASAYVVARTVADSEFLSKVGTEDLPAMYMISAGLVAMTTVIYGGLLRRTSFRKVAIGTLVILAAISFAEPVLMGSYQSSFLFASVYLIAQVRGTLGTIQFATLFNEQFRKRPEKYVGVIGFSATLGGFVFGSFAVGSDLFGSVESMMYWVGCLDLLAIAPLLLLKNTETKPARGRVTRAFASSRRNPAMMSVLRSSHVRGVSLVVLLAVMAVTIVDFEWKIAAADYFARDELSLTKYFGGVYACVALSTGLVQFVATRKLLTKKRFATAVQTYPVVLFATVGAAIYYSSGLDSPIDTVTSTM